MYWNGNFLFVLSCVIVTYHLTQVTSACRNIVPSIKNARLVSTIRSVNRTKSKRKRFKSGETAVLKCNDGFALEGLPLVLRCQRNGKWTRIPTRVPPWCKPQTGDCAYTCLNGQKIACNKRCDCRCDCMDGSDERCGNIACQKSVTSVPASATDNDEHYYLRTPTPTGSDGHYPHNIIPTPTPTEPSAILREQFDRDTFGETRSTSSSHNRLDDQHVALIIGVSFFVTVLIAFSAWLYQKCRNSRSLTLQHSVSTILITENNSEERILDLTERPSPIHGPRVLGTSNVPTLGNQLHLYEGPAKSCSYTYYGLYEKDSPVLPPKSGHKAPL